MAAEERRPRVLLLCSGSVATVKVPQIAAQLHEFADVRLVATAAATHFLERAEAYNPEAWAAFQALPAAAREPTLDRHEWEAWDAVGDEVLHISLRNWADAAVFAPLSANTLAKLAGGLCDNLVTCVARAWDAAKPVVAAPAMNTYMWDHPLTQQHIAAVEALGARVVPPVAKVLACGDVGNGALAPPEVVVEAVRGALGIDGGG